MLAGTVGGGRQSYVGQMECCHSPGLKDRPEPPGLGPRGGWSLCSCEQHRVLSSLTNNLHGLSLGARGLNPVPSPCSNILPFPGPQCPNLYGMDSGLSDLLRAFPALAFAIMDWAMGLQVATPG